jgi:hypothetical protein
LANTTLDSLGSFTLEIPKNYAGRAILKTQGKSRLIVFVDKEDLVLKGTHLKEPDSIIFINSLEKHQFCKN